MGKVSTGLFYKSSLGITLCVQVENTLGVHRYESVLLTTLRWKAAILTV